MCIYRFLAIINFVSFEKTLFVLYRFYFILKFLNNTILFKNLQSYKLILSCTKRWSWWTSSEASQRKLLVHNTNDTPRCAAVYGGRWVRWVVPQSLTPAWLHTVRGSTYIEEWTTPWTQWSQSVNIEQFNLRQ